MTHPGRGRQKQRARYGRGHHVCGRHRQREAGGEGTPLPLLPGTPCFGQPRSDPTSLLGGDHRLFRGVGAPQQPKQQATDCTPTPHREQAGAHPGPEWGAVPGPRGRYVVVRPQRRRQQAAKPGGLYEPRPLERGSHPPPETG